MSSRWYETEKRQYWSNLGGAGLKRRGGGNIWFLSIPLLFLLCNPWSNIIISSHSLFLYYWVLACLPLFYPPLLYGCSFPGFWWCSPTLTFCYKELRGKNLSSKCLSSVELLVPLGESRGLLLLPPSIPKSRVLKMKMPHEKQFQVKKWKVGRGKGTSASIWYQLKLSDKKCHYF